MPFGHRVNEAEARLREWLETTAPQRGTRLPSERALALQLGLQHYALNRAMGHLIIEGLVERDGYKLLAAGPKPIRSSFSCHLVVALRSIYIPSYRKVAKEMGIKLILDTWQSTDEALLKLDKIDVRETEAVVFDPPHAAPVSLWEPIATRLHKHGIPVVCLGQALPGLFSVLPDTTQSLHLAFAHLVELGHREIGMVTPSPSTPAFAEVLETWEQLCRKNDLTRSIHRVHHQNNMRLREEADEVASLLVEGWSTATALIVVTMADSNIQLLQELLVQKGRRLPGDLSLLFIGDSKIASTATPPVSSVSVEMALTQETAFYLAQRAARKTKAIGLLPPPASVRVQPQLFIRNSTGPAASAAPKTPKSPIPAEAAPKTPAPKPIPEINAGLESLLRKAYPLASRAFLSERSRFQTIDLGPHVNRPLNFRRGWLGDLPLKQLAPGSHEIHGVPFQILGGPKRSDCGSIVFHSAVNTTGNAQKLPDKLKIPIGSKAQAVYILHGCGYAKFRHTVAHYGFHSRRACLEVIPIVSLGQPPAGYNPSQRDEPATNTVTPNIQDWWPDFPHTDFPHSRMAPIADSENALNASRYVYLYTLEWINPSPQTVVSHLEITVDATHSTTLGVLAATVLKP